MKSPTEAGLKIFIYSAVADYCDKIKDSYKMKSPTEAGLKIFIYSAVADYCDKIKD